MSRITAILVGAMVVLPIPVYGIEIVQTTGGLVQGTDWDDDGDGTITIFQVHSDKTYVFWAHVDGQPSVLAEILAINRDTVNLTSGTIKVQISKSGAPGATNLGKITFDTANITSIVEGISVTGDFLTTAITVDQITGPIEVGGSLTAGLTVNEDLEGAVSIEGAVVTGADVYILGDVLEPISIGTYIPNRTASSYDSITAVDAPITVYGNLVAPIYVYGQLDAPITIQGDVIGANTSFHGGTVPLGLRGWGDMNADVTIEGEQLAHLVIEGDLAAFV